MARGLVVPSAISPRIYRNLSLATGQDWWAQKISLTDCPGRRADYVASGSPSARTSARRGPFSRLAVSAQRATASARRPRAHDRSLATCRRASRARVASERPPGLLPDRAVLPVADQRQWLSWPESGRRSEVLRRQTAVEKGAKARHPVVPKGGGPAPPEGGEGTQAPLVRVSHSAAEVLDCW